MVKKHQQAKSKHHHVWADYLRRWSLNGRDVYYTTEKGNIVCESVRGLAMEKHFYKVRPLNNTHIELIKGFSSVGSKDLHALHMSYLKDFLRIQKLESIYRNSGEQVEEIEGVLHASKSNMLEDLHSAHENDVQKIIHSLANRDLTMLSEEKNLMLFVQFFGHQISRTKTFKDTIISGMARADSKTPKNIANAMGECWWFLSYMFGMNIGASLYLTRKIDKHCLLLNETNTPFITSDQPIINVHNSLDDEEFVPPSDEQCDFYYPISPQVAYMINKSDRFQQGINIVSIDTVNELNLKVARKANINIVSDSEESLKILLKSIGAHINTVKSCLQ